MQAADERQLRITSTLEYGAPPRRVGSAFVSGITSAPHIFTHSTPGGITATVSVLPCNAHGNPDLNTENYVLALRQDTNTTYPLLAPMSSDPYLVHGSFKPDPCGGWELRIAWPNKPKPPARDADSDSAIHSLTKKYTPLRFQLVHCPTGWCSGLSQGFLLRTKWEPGKSSRYVEPLEYPPPPFCPALATAVAPLCAAWNVKQTQMGEVGDGGEGVDGAEGYALGGMPGMPMPGMPLPAAMAGLAGAGAGAGAGAAPAADGTLASLAGLMPAPPPPVPVPSAANSALNALASAATGGAGGRGRAGAAGAVPPGGVASLSSLFAGAGAGAGPVPAVPGLLDSINAVMIPGGVGVGAMGGAGAPLTPALLKKIAPVVDTAMQRALQASLGERAATLASAAGSSSSSGSSSGDAAAPAADGLVAATSLVAHLQTELAVPLPLAAVAATGAAIATAAAGEAAAAEPAAAASSTGVGRKRNAAAAAASAAAASAAAAAPAAAGGAASAADGASSAAAAPRSAKKSRPAGEEATA